MEPRRAISHYLRKSSGAKRGSKPYDAVLAFWVAYILTRPLGASLGDYLSQARQDGGLGLGPTVTSAVFLSAILLLVVYLSLTRADEISGGTAPDEKVDGVPLLPIPATVKVKD